MDPSIFGALGGMGGGAQGGLGGILAKISGQMNPGGAPAAPADGAMQPTIGPGAAPAAPAYTPKLGMPKGGLLGLLQGGQPNGIMGLLQHLKAPGTSLAGGMPPAGMLSGLPGTPGATAEGPVAPQPQLPMNINPMDQF